jgi:predicted PurR-regulated permease PerM
MSNEPVEPPDIQASPATADLGMDLVPPDLPGTEPSAVSPGVRQPPLNVRNKAMVVLAVLGSVFMLHWARDVFVPLMLAILASYALMPIVNRLERLRLPRAAGAALLLAAILGGLGSTAYALSDEAGQFLDFLPEAAQKIRQVARAQRNSPATPLDKVQQAATQLEQAAAEGAANTSAAQRGVTRVQIERPRFDIKGYLWDLTPGLMASAAQLVVVVFITYFLLLAGSDFRRKMVRLAGPTLTEKRVTVQAMDEISSQIQRYLLLQVLISLFVGLATWLAYWALGVQHAAVWGVVACVLNFVPYIGSLLVTAGSALVGFVQFGSVDMALLVGGVSLLLHTITGNLIAPWLTGRTNRMNPVAVFVGVLAFGWLWGIWGLLLGVPILLIVKTVCDHVEGLKPVGELLGA